MRWMGAQLLEHFSGGGGKAGRAHLVVWALKTSRSLKKILARADRARSHMWLVSGGIPGEKALGLTKQS